MSGVRKTSGAARTRGAVREFPAGRARAQAVDSPGRTDGRGITDRARELSAELNAVVEMDESRAERVRTLKAQIANGTYNPDPREIARKLLERGF